MSNLGLQRSFEVWPGFILWLLSVHNSDGFGSIFFVQGQFKSIFVSWVGSAIFGLGLGLENFPLKSKIRVKIKSFRVGSKRAQIKDGSLLFTTGQKYPHVGLGQGPPLVHKSIYLKWYWDNEVRNDNCIVSMMPTFSKLFTISILKKVIFIFESMKY